jgi:hypothetical protein
MNLFVPRTPWAGAAPDHEQKSSYVIIVDLNGRAGRTITASAHLEPRPGRVRAMPATSKQQMPSRHAEVAVLDLAVPVLAATLLRLRESAAMLAVTVSSGTGPSSPSSACADAAAASTAAQMTAQAWQLVQSAMPPGPPVEPASALADAPRLAQATQALSGICGLLAEQSGPLAAAHLGQAAVCLAAAAGELSRISTRLPHPADSR